MSILAALFHVLVIVYRLVVALWNAWTILLRVMRSAIQEAKQEADEVIALMDDDAPLMDAITTPLLSDIPEPMNRGQVLVIARGSSFVLLFRLSERRVLHLEVDERFIMARLEVIQTELMLDIRHVPCLLQVPIGMCETQLVKYTPMRFPYVWKEERVVSGNEEAIIPAPSSPISARSEGRSHRKKCVQVLKESALRRRLHMDRLGSGTTPKRGVGIGKARGDMVKRKALANSTNKATTDSTDAERASDDARGVADTPKQVRMERNIHAALSENLSLSNMLQAASKASEGVQHRRRRSQFDLYAQGVQGGFSFKADE